jgi:hypothetical protein
MVFGTVIPGTRLFGIRELHDYQTTSPVTLDHFGLVAHHEELAPVILQETLDVPRLAIFLVSRRVFNVDYYDNVCRHPFFPLSSSRMRRRCVT